MPVSIRVDIDTSGPLFRGGKERIHAATRRIVQAMIEAGEQRLDETLRPRPKGVYLSVAEAGKGKGSTGHYRRNVHSRQVNLAGIITDGGVVYGPWLEGTSSRNQSTRFKGYRSFRRTYQWLRENVGKITRPVVDRMTKDLGG